MAEILFEIIENEEFLEELEEISSYAINIKQERPIQYLLARNLNDRGVEYALEYGKYCPKAKKKVKYDLYIEGQTVEMKFFFERDFRSFETSRDNFKNKREGKKKDGFYNDIIYKACDIFLLIVQSRDLENIGNIPKDTICVYEDTIRSIKNDAYDYDVYRENLEKFFQVINEDRPILDDSKRKKYRIKTKFESIYRFYILEF